MSFTQYRSGRGIAVGAFSPPRTNQGIPLQPVQMSGQTGAPQTPKWSIADAIMSSTYADELDKYEWMTDIDDDEYDDDDVWDEWNTQRYDVLRDYQAESRDVQHLRLLIRDVLREVNAMATGNVSGVTLPLGMSAHDDDLDNSSDDDDDVVSAFGGGSSYDR